MDAPQPGQTIAPHSENNQPEAVVQPVNDDSKAAEPASQWQFKADDAGADPAPAKKPATTDQEVSWSASEYIAHHKSPGWYLGLALVAVVVAAVVFLLTHDKISTSVIIVAALALGIFGARKPRVLDYKLDEAGLNIGQKFYGYELFKSFAVIEEGAFSSVLLLPLKRFSPSLSLYYDPDDEQKIVDMLAERMPVEDRKQDAVDSFMHRIRF